MPSGRTHDRITLWSLPVVAGLTFGLTKSGNLTLLVAGGYLFSGLMFGPDLDIHSRQFIRWGWLRWIWIPYQKTLRHRSIFSHGPIIGTIGRSLYLAICLSILGIIVLGILQFLWGVGWTWQTVAELGKRSLQYTSEWLALFLGLELGAMSHSLSDWTGTGYKRFKSKGLAGLLPKPKKRKQIRRTNPQRSLRKKTAKTRSRTK